MKGSSRIQNWFSRRFQISSFSTLALYIAGLFGLYLLILFNARLLAPISPLLAAGLSWFWFLLPGLLLSHYFAPHVSWWERFPIAFVLTIGIVTPITVAAILLHLTLNLFIVLHTGILIAAAGILIYLSLTDKLSKPEIDPLEVSPPAKYRLSSGLLLAIFIVICLILSFLAMKWPITGDDTAILPLFSDVLDQNRISGVEPFHGSEVPVTPRNELIVATYVEILTAKVSGTLPQEFIINSRPYLVILAILSLGVFLNQFTKDKRQNLFLLCLWGVYLLATLKADRTGSDFITRIFQDKFLGWFIIVPIALFFMLRFVETHRWKNLLAFGIVTLGASMVHPITLTQVMMLTGGFGIVHFIINRNRVTFKNLFFVAVVLLLCTFIPFLQYIRYTNYMPVDLVGLGDAVEFGRLSAAVGRYRLWLLDGGRFILHPSVILQPIIIAAYVLLPLIIHKFRQQYLAQLLIGGMILLPILLYIPPLAAIVGKVVTPYLLWRLAWPFSLFSILVIGKVLWYAALTVDEKLSLKGIQPTKTGFLYPAVIVLTLMIATFNIWQGAKDYTERRSAVFSSNCENAMKLFDYLAEVTKDTPANVLSSHDLNLCIPGYAPNANVIEYRGYGTINRLSYDNIEESIQRVEDVNYFSGARLFDDYLLRALNLHKIDYVLIQRDQLELDLQIKYLPNYFVTVFEDDDFRLYKVRNKEKTSKIIEANTALRQNRYDSAKDAYFQVLQEDPDNVLANLGLGLAEEGLGNSSRAIDYYQRAILFAPGEPALHAQLASAYLLMRDFDKSAETLNTAIGLSQNRADLHKSLGQAYVLLGEAKAAEASFEKYASLRAVKYSASYYSLLGNSLQSVDLLKDQAVAYQKKAISIQPDTRRSINLARSWVLLGETETAVKELQKAIRLDRWNYLPHLELGYIHWDQGDIDGAIREFDVACRLNPANVSAYILLGKAIQERDGTAAAITKLEELMQINQVLPGPYRSLALVRASSGEFNDAMVAIDRSAVIQPKSATVLTSKGYISMIAGQMDNAFAAFEEALTTYPDLVSAILGLGMYYNIEANYELEAGQFRDIVQLVPTASWIHLVIGEMYRQQGDYPSALEEITWAIRLDPDNPNGYIARGDIFKNQSNWSLALSDYTIANELDPQNYTALLRMGEVFESRANYVKAEELYTQAVGLHPDAVSPLIQLANLYWQLGRTDEAEVLEKTIQELAPDSSLVMIRVANSQMKLGNIAEARSIFNQIIQNTPNMVAAHISLAQLVQEEDNDLSVVYSIYNNLLQENQGSAEAYLAVGRYLMDQGQYETAVQSFQAALSYSNVSAENYLALSELQLKQGRNEEAFSTLETAVKHFPGNATLLSSLGYYYLQRMDLLNAESYFNKAIDLNPTFLDAYIGISQLELMKGNKTRAEMVLQRAISNNAGSQEAIIALADFQESGGDLKLAEASIDKALQINPSNFKTNQAAGLFYLRQNRYAEAYERFQALLDLPGSKVEAYLQLGSLAMGQSQPDEALRWYQSANLEDRSDVRPYMEMSNAYQAQGQFQAALDALMTAYQFKPASVEVNLAIGELSEKLGNSADARRYFEKAVLLDEGKAASLIALAEMDLGERMWPEAITKLGLAASKELGNFQTFYALAEAYQMAGDCSTAEITLKEGIQRTANKFAGYHGAADIMERCGYWETAQAYYELAWEEQPESPQAGWALVDYFQRRNDHDQTIAVLNRIERMTGESSEILAAFGKVYALQANWKEAEAAFTQALDSGATTADAYLGLGSVLENQGKFAAAAGLYQEAAEQFEQSADVHIKLGAALEKLGKLEEARVAYQKAFELDPINLASNLSIQQLDAQLGQPGDGSLLAVEQVIEGPTSTALTTIGQLNQIQGEWTEALAWFQRAVHNDPLNGENWYYLGNYHRSLAQWSKALESYARALEMNPGSSTILTAMGQVQEELGLFEDAQRSYRKAIDARPGDIAGYASLAKLQLYLGKSEDALMTIQQGITQAPADYRGYETLGDLYISLEPENPDQAEEAYRSGLAVLAGSPELNVKIGNLYNDQASAVWKEYNQARAYENWAKNQYENLIHQIGTEEEFIVLPRFLQEKLEEATLAYEQSRGSRIAAQAEYEKAIETLLVAEESYNQALNLDPGNVQALMGMARLRMSQGLSAEAGVFYEKAYAENPYSSLALLALGIYYQDIGQAEKALGILAKANVLEPGNREIQIALSSAIQNLPALSITQASMSAEQSTYKLRTLVSDLRQESAQ